MSLQYTSANSDYSQEVTQAISASSDFAISLWAYATAGMTNVNQTICNMSISGSTHYVRIYYYTGYQETKPPYAITPAQYKAAIYDGSTTVTLLGGASGTWNHIALRCAGVGGNISDSYLYRNGTLQDSDATVVSPIDLTRMHVGCKISGLTRSEYFDGYVAELAHYSGSSGTAVLTAGDIDGLAHGWSPRLVQFNNLTAYYPLRSSACWGTLDLSQANLGTMTYNYADWATAHPRVIDPCGPQIRSGATKRREICIDGLVTSIP